MKRLHIVGCQGHGKTTLILELLGELTQRGLRVGTIKHSTHEHELDHPGKDSHRHRLAGGQPAAVISVNLLAAFLPLTPEADPYRLLAPLYRGCDIVLVEGHIITRGPKIEVWRQELGTPPLAMEHKDIIALVTNDPVEVAIPLWPRQDIASLATRVLGMV